MSALIQAGKDLNKAQFGGISGWKDGISRFDPAGTALNFYGDSKYRTEVSKWDPLGQMTGVYGGKAGRYAYDPVGLKMGLYGYEVKAAPDMGQYVYAPGQMASPANAQSVAKPAQPLLAGNDSTSKYLLGQ